MRSECVAPVAHLREGETGATGVTGGRIGPMRASRSLPDEIDHCATMHHAREIERIPVGEPDAAMRFGFADLLRRRRAMDAVARRAQIDPDDADWIFRTRSDRKFVLGLHAFEAETRIVMIGRVMCYAFDLELSAWSGLFGAAD